MRWYVWIRYRLCNLCLSVCGYSAKVECKTGHKKSAKVPVDVKCVCVYIYILVRLILNSYACVCAYACIMSRHRRLDGTRCTQSTMTKLVSWCVKTTTLNAGGQVLTFLLPWSVVHKRCTLVIGMDAHVLGTSFPPDWLFWLYTWHTRILGLFYLYSMSLLLA